MSNSLVLVINSGSSSLKFSVIDSKTGDAELSGIGECFGLPEANISWKYQGQKSEQVLTAGSNHHQEAIAIIVNLVKELGLTEKLVAIGHRVVHGGDKFSTAVQIDDKVINEIERISDLAPLHNPAHLIGIRAAIAAFPQLPQFAVFDTAFHQTMPERAFSYAISQKLYRDYGVRRYGFHGTSHYYISRAAAEYLNRPAKECSFITVHLGNGSSICAVKNGESVDTSMGLTPLAGLMMGTRSGDLDPIIPEYLMSKGMTMQEVHDELHNNSGFLGVSELTSDCRGIISAAAEGHHGAQLAIDIFTYRVAKYIASYMVALDQLDAIVFTGGIGENSVPMRSEILRHLKMFGYKEDVAANKAAALGEMGPITQPNTPLALVIPTNEEWVIAKQSVELLEQ
ncbi:acetate/propionate family kinase [Vibrio sp. SS-MA-C1-2]|uniref:acetate/propionate family kinase n=1 Tax=Vibrio sp. SS-MA-C1-2 TaxID=2908646 RepID=UPI001EFFB08E|nr:acetate/propionate family kinase [Vibrio sp. SS-MA-C1-2]UJF16819.1 acetate/propionate family kinase [Vibrio sp. SS-MA-C1-2]